MRITRDIRQRPLLHRHSAPMLVLLVAVTCGPAWAADTLVLPSAYEANALVLLEALACGLPVVATRVGFAPELVRDGDNGFLVDRTAAAVGDRLDAVDHLDPADRARMSAEARATALRYAWPEIARRYLELVESLRTDREVPA